MRDAGFTFTLTLRGSGSGPMVWEGVGKARIQTGSFVGGFVRFPPEITW